MADFFEKKQQQKKQENPNFVPLCRNVNLPLKLNCISFCRLKILSHLQKKFEMSNVEILRKVVNRHMDRQYMLWITLVPYDIVSLGVLSLLFVNRPSAFFYTSFFKYRPSSLQEREDIEHL